MDKVKIGVLHPGEMGVSVAASAIDGGNEVFWASKGRSSQTFSRAENSGLIERESLKKLCDEVHLIISVCPPHAAEDVLRDVIERGYKGIYVDANAISPQKAILMGQRCASAGINFIDGSIVGGPAWQPDSTFLYLSGEDAARVAALFQDGLLEAVVLGEEIGRASALKMCYAAYSKGSTALLSMILAASDALDVRPELMSLWSEGGAQFAEQAEMRTRRATRKAWRFAGEMNEIADTFEAVGLPGGFHRAARSIYHRTSRFRGDPELPEIEIVIQALLEGDDIG